MSREVVPQNRCSPYPGDIVEIQMTTTSTRQAIFKRLARGSDRTAIVQMEREDMAGTYGRERAVDAWCILRVVVPASREVAS